MSYCSIVKKTSFYTDFLWSFLYSNSNIFLSKVKENKIIENDMDNGVRDIVSNSIQIRSLTSVQYI